MPATRAPAPLDPTLDTGPDGIITLSKRLDTSTAESLFRSLEERETSNVILDAAHVEMIGARCVEVLLGAKHHWQSTQKTVRYLAPTYAMKENLGRMGLTIEDLSTGECA